VDNESLSARKMGPLGVDNALKQLLHFVDRILGCFISVIGEGQWQGLKDVIWSGRLFWVSLLSEARSSTSISIEPHLGISV